MKKTKAPIATSKPATKTVEAKTKTKIKAKTNSGAKPASKPPAAIAKTSAPKVATKKVPAQAQKGSSKAPSAATKKKPVTKAVESAVKTIGAAKAAKSAAAGPRIFQIYDQREQLPLLDIELEPYNNIGDKSPLLEFNVFLKMHLDKTLQNVPLWGALSWKFGQKTGLSGADLKKLIADNPGYDVYYCNPEPEAEALYHNLWLHGETEHPNFLAVAEEFLKCAEMSADSMNDIHPSALFSTANYLIGTPTFWEKYLKFVGLALALAERKLSPETRSILYGAANDKHQQPYIPLVIERLFAQFLIKEGSKVKAFKLPLPSTESQLNVHLKMLRQMKDVAHAQRSLWLTACWANYRTLYLASIRDKGWLQKNLRAITPPTTRFANFGQASK